MGRHGRCAPFEARLRRAPPDEEVCVLQSPNVLHPEVRAKRASKDAPRLCKGLAALVIAFTPLPALAEMAGLSVYQFDQRIRSLFHVTAGQYLVKVRIDAACKRLTGTQEAIAQIALACGYSDQSAFSRQFKQAVGISPMAYRKKLGDG